MASMVTKMIADIEKAKKASMKAKKDFRDHVDEDQLIRAMNGAYNSVLNDKADTIERLCDILEDPDNRYANSMHRLATIVSGKSQSLKQKQEYCITIRPHPDAPITFGEFKKMIELHVVTRKCFIEGNYSFEQKGTTPEELGYGFHVHIGAKMTQSSKGQVIRDLKNTFKEWLDKGYMNDAGIDVFTRKDAIAWFNTYCLEYESDDNHKEVTRCWDELWRTGNGVQRCYTITH